MIGGVRSGECKGRSAEWGSWRQNGRMNERMYERIDERIATSARCQITMGDLLPGRFHVPVNPLHPPCATLKSP